MKLSQAIRKGCKIARKQTSDQLFNWNNKGKPVAACVLGAAMLGCGINPTMTGPDSESPEFRIFRNKYETILDQQMQHPKNRGEISTLQDIMTELNDDWHTPRYKIARWLERKGL